MSLRSHVDGLVQAVEVPALSPSADHHLLQQKSSSAALPAKTSYVHTASGASGSPLCTLYVEDFIALPGTHDGHGRCLTPDCPLGFVGRHPHRPSSSVLPPSPPQRSATPVPVPVSYTSGLAAPYP
eukprot:RCo049132